MGMGLRLAALRAAGVPLKKSNHKLRSRDLLLTRMCSAFMCSGNLRSYWEQQIQVVIGRENYNRNRKCRICLV